VEEEAKEFGGAVPSVGKAPKSRGPKKKIAKNLAAAVIPDKDDDGSTRVLGYRGVWLSAAQKRYFIKIGGVPLTNIIEGKEVTLFLDTVEEAAKRYDDVITTRGRAREVEMNYREDGSRIVVRHVHIFCFVSRPSHHLIIVFVYSMMTRFRRYKKRVRILLLLSPHLPSSTSRICQNTSSPFFVTQTRLLAQAGIQKGMYMHTVEFAVNKGKVMIVGKVRYLSMVATITSAPLILNGMLQLCMVSDCFPGLFTVFSASNKILQSFFCSLGTPYFIWRRSNKASSTRGGRGRCQI